VTKNRWEPGERYGSSDIQDLMEEVKTPEKPVEWVASAKDDLSAFPVEVKRDMGQAIFEAQLGEKSPQAKPLKGDQFKGSGVCEIVDDFDGDTYRAVYTVRFQGVVYVLDAFQKKSTTGSKTAKVDMDRIASRLKLARDHYEMNYKKPPK
jgi:phage-related protein